MGIGDCNGCGKENVKIRFLRLPSEEETEEPGWNYCRECWPSIVLQWAQEMVERELGPFENMKR